MIDTRKPSVAVVGCGEMGGAVQRRLLARGVKVVVRDPDPTQTAPLLAAGAQVAADAAEAAGAADFVLVLVNTERQLREVFSEIAPVRPQGHGIAVMSTVSPKTMRELAGLYPRIVDAPVSGGPSRAAEGRLTFMIGGGADDVGGLRPTFEHLAAHVIPCGDPGAAQAAKIVNNVLCHANTVLMAEALLLGRSQGLDTETMRQVMDASTGRNYLTDARGAAERLYAGLTRDAEAFDAILQILRKDLDIAASVASAAGQQLPGVQALGALLHGIGGETFEIWRDLAGSNRAEN